jgi:uncharacterized protein
LWSTGMHEPAIELTIAQTVGWLKREMTAPQGYFYAAQDADSFIIKDDTEPKEGAFYVWSYTELERHLKSEELQALAEQFIVTPTGNFEGKIVLQRYQSGLQSPALAAALAKLFVLRYGSEPEATSTFPLARSNQDAKANPWIGRIPPVTDTKAIVAWNSLMISGLAKAATAFQTVEYLNLAVTAAQFILKHQWIGERFHRLNYNGQPSNTAQSEDYALFIKALLDLQQASLPVCSAMHPWLSHAILVQKEFDERLWCKELGGYYNADASPNLTIRERSFDDSSIPSANGVAIANLVRLFLLTEDIAYLDRAERALKAFISIAIDTPQRCPSLFAALDWFYNQTRIQVGAEAIAPLIAHYLPTAIFQLKTDLNSTVVGLVCQGLSCQIPAFSWEQLQSQVNESIARS